MKKKSYILFLSFSIAFILAQQTYPVKIHNDTIENKISLSQLEDTLSLNDRVHFQENFQEKYSSKDYHYEEIPKKTPLNDRKSFTLSWDWLNNLSIDTITSFITWVSILFLVSSIGYILYFNFSNTTFKSRKIAPRSLKEIATLSEEEIITSSNLDAIDQLILEAQNEYNYRLALRLQFLKVFKKMIEKKIFQFKKDKTNNEYYTEINSKELKVSFKKISYWYEYIWYGEYPIDNLLYNKALLEFKTILKYLS